jgi:hypothetical protein
MLFTIAQVISLWFSMATVTAFTLGAAFGALSAAPKPALVPVRFVRPGQAAREDSANRVACGAGR